MLATLVGVAGVIVLLAMPPLRVRRRPAPVAVVPPVQIDLTPYELVFDPVGESIANGADHRVMPPVAGDPPNGAPTSPNGFDSDPGEARVRPSRDDPDRR